MKSEQSINEVLSRIIHDAETQKVNFADPDNAFTVWADQRKCMQFCGSNKSIDAAWMLAGEHPAHQHDLYILNAEIKPFGILQFDNGSSGFDVTLTSPR